MWVFLFQRISPDEDRPEHLIDRENDATLFKYRALFMALSMIPALLIGAQLLKVLHLVYEGSVYKIYQLLRHGY